MNIRSRLTRLETGATAAAKQEPDPEFVEMCEHLYRTELESPLSTLIHDEERGEFYTLDGKLALSRHGYANIERMFQAYDAAIEEEEGEGGR